MFKKDELLTQKIMVVDDNPTNVFLLEKILHIEGYYNINSETDSRMVMSTVDSYHPDLLLLDLKMPHIDGFEILQAMRERNTEDIIPIIVITAQNDKENRLKAFSLGANDFIGKPFDQIEVLTRIRNFLEIRILHSRVRKSNNDLEQKVIERTKALSDLQTELFERLLRSVEFRDTETGNHITRIGVYSYILGKALGFSEEDAYQLYTASKLHDIGKIAIPDKILLKEDKLTPEEFEEMKTHALKGAKILQGSTIPTLRLAEEIAISHHEHWDGNGYPYGLSGEQIPLVGRITALVDVFDALTTKRPYKEAWSFDVAFEHVISQRGLQFDPHLVDVFIECKQEILLASDDLK